MAKSYLGDERGNHDQRTTLVGRMIMLAKLKTAAIMLTLSCVSSAEVQHPEPPMPSPQELARWAAEREREEMESQVRLSVYYKCGGDRELRCQQLAPRILRGIEPTIPVNALRCSGTGEWPKRTRSCDFNIGHESRPTVDCSIKFWERPGHHVPYWSDEVFSDESAGSPRSDTIPSVKFGRSSLTCNGPLLALTEKPEPVDKAPATPPRLASYPPTLITEEDYPIPAFSEGREGAVVARVQVGSHGRIDTCTVTKSSGLKFLDDRACELFKARARFEPARNQQGQDVAAETILSHHWKATN